MALSYLVSSPDCHVLSHGMDNDFLVVLIPAVVKTGKPFRSLKLGLSHNYRMTSVVLTGAPNVHKSSRRATLCLTDLVRIAKQIRRQVYAAQTRISFAVVLQQQEEQHHREHTPRLLRSSHVSLSL